MVKMVMLWGLMNEQCLSFAGGSGCEAKVYLRSTIQ